MHPMKKLLTCCRTNIRLQVLNMSEGSARVLFFLKLKYRQVKVNVRSHIYLTFKIILNISVKK